MPRFVPAKATIEPLRHGRYLSKHQRSSDLQEPNCNSCQLHRNSLYFVQGQLTSNLTSRTSRLRQPQPKLPSMSALPRLMCRSALRRNIIPLSLGLSTSLLVASRRSPMRLDSHYAPATRPISTESKPRLNAEVVKQLSSGSLSGTDGTLDGIRGSSLTQSRFRTWPCGQFILQGVGSIRRSGHRGFRGMSN